MMEEHRVVNYRRHFLVGADMSDSVESSDKPLWKLMGRNRELVHEVEGLLDHLQFAAATEIVYLHQFGFEFDASIIAERIRHIRRLFEVREFAGFVASDEAVSASVRMMHSPEEYREIQEIVELFNG